MPTVNPKIIEWARSTAGLTVDEAALALGIASVDRLKAHVGRNNIAPNVLVDRATDRPYPTFHRLVHQGIYPVDWAGNNEVKMRYD